MSNRFLILLFTGLLFLGLRVVAADEEQVDPKLAERATVIIRAQRLRTIPGPLQPGDEVKVIAVLKNDLKVKLGETLRIKRGEFSSAVPDKPCTVYLTQSKKPIGWLLLGVGHVAADAAKSANADWQVLFEKERWYQSQQGKEAIFRGKLESVPSADAPSTLQRVAYYRLGKRMIYSGAKKVAILDRLVGQQAEIRGKAVDFELEGQAVREIWPAAVRASLKEQPMEEKSTKQPNAANDDTMKVDVKRSYPKTGGTIEETTVTKLVDGRRVIVSRTVSKYRQRIIDKPEGKSGTIIGRVVTEAGEPITDAEVHIYPNRRDGVWLMKTTTDKKGTFKLAVPVEPEVVISAKETAHGAGQKISLVVEGKTTDVGDVAVIQRPL